MVVLMRAFTGISIHAPRAGSDENALKNWSTLSSFQSTLPVRGATSKEDKQKMETTISIHAPRAGSDLTGMSDPEKWIRFQSTLPVRGATYKSWPFSAIHSDFNPRSPCGERPNVKKIAGSYFIFQSTLPVRGATTSHALAEEYREISIHAPRAGSDANLDSMPPLRLSRFQSTLPVRGATMQLEIIVTTRRDFNPRSPCGERRE